MPTACPAKTWLRLIFFLPRQMRPQRVTTMILSWKGRVRQFCMVPRRNLAYYLAQSRGQTYAERSQTIRVERGFRRPRVSKVPRQYSTSLDQECSEFAEAHRAGDR